MGNSLEFILRLQDQLSPAIRQATVVADSSAMRMQTDMEKVAGSTRHVTKEVENLKEKSRGLNIGHMLEGIGISMGIFEVVDLMKEGIEKAHHFHEAEAALANTMKNMGTYSEEAFEKVVAGAGAMSANMKFSRTEVIDLQSQLRMVGNIGEAEMQRMTKASADMATKFHIGLSDAGNSIAKAVNNPEMLRRLGMQLKIDPAMQVHLQNLAKHGHEAAARLQLLSIVESKVGGAAQAAFDADPMARYNKAISSIQITMGDAAIKIQKWLAPALEGLAVAFSNVVKWAASAVTWMSQHKDIITGLAIVIGGLTLAISWNTIVTKGAAIATGIWEGAQAALNFVMNMNPILRIVSLLIILGGFIYMIVKHYDGWGKSTKGLWEIIKGFGNLTVVVFKDMAETIWYHIQYVWYKTKGFFEWINGAIGNVYQALQLAAKFDFSGAAKALTANITVTATQDLAELEKRHNAGKLANQQSFNAALQQMATGKSMIGLTKVAGSKGTNPLEANGEGGMGGAGGGGILDGGKDKADSINRGGQRTVTINISKIIDKLEVHVMSAKEGVNEIGGMVREEMRKVMYNLNEAKPQ